MGWVKRAQATLEERRRRSEWLSRASGFRVRTTRGTEVAPVKASAAWIADPFGILSSSWITMPAPLTSGARAFLALVQ